MGCATSKQPVCRNCQAPMPRSYSMHVHHRPQQEGDTYHVVALTSSTLGSLKLDSIDPNHRQKREAAPVKDDDDEKRNGAGDDDVFLDNRRSKEFSMGVIEAKTWSKMLSEKIPKFVPETPVQTPPGEPETINTWELMEGLEDHTSPLRQNPHHIRSFSFHVAPNSLYDFSKSEPPKGINGEATPKPMWLQMADNESNSTSVIPEFDPDLIATFRKALEELPAANPFHLKPLDGEKQQAAAGNNIGLLEVTDHLNKVNDYNKLTSRGSKDKLVLYFTSLRGVRKTYEDCCHVRVILKGMGVRIDERDVSMHSGFKEELKDLLGDRFNGGGGGGLPRVFLNKGYIGGVEEIRRMHEDGKLEKLLQGCEMVDEDGVGGGCGGGRVCEACGDIRFVPCETCSGSCKIYNEGDHYYGEEQFDHPETEGDCGFQRCPDCNENGIVRCPICCA